MDEPDQPIDLPGELASLFTPRGEAQAGEPGPDRRPPGDVRNPSLRRQRTAEEIAPSG